MPSSSQASVHGSPCAWQKAEHVPSAVITTAAQGAQAPHVCAPAVRCVPSYPFHDAGSQPPGGDGDGGGGVYGVVVVRLQQPAKLHAELSLGGSAAAPPHRITPDGKASAAIDVQLPGNAIMPFRAVAAKALYPMLASPLPSVNDASDVHS